MTKPQNSDKNDKYDDLSRRIITEIFITVASVLSIFVYLMKEFSYNFAYIRGTPYVAETVVIVKEIVPDEMIVNINTAGIDELMTLEGIGEVTAKNIIDYRENNNGFLTIDELLKVDGIGEAKLEKIRSYVTLE